MIRTANERFSATFVDWIFAIYAACGSTWVKSTNWTQAQDDLSVAIKIWTTDHKSRAPWERWAKNSAQCTRRKKNKRFVLFQRNVRTMPSDCEFCGKKFECGSNWRRHILTHTNVRNHTCELCGQGYARKDRLDTHMLLHTGERPYTCRYCPKAFRLSKNMLTHERVHTGEKPFKCVYPECGKAFARLESFSRHKRVHARIRPFPCQMCEKKFATNYHLQRHMTVHTGQKPYCCDQCGNRFTQLGSLTLHKAKVHAPPPPKTN